GDAILQEFVRRLGQVTRASDMIARLGGEEFAVVTPDADIGLASRIAERLRLAVCETEFPMEDGKTVAVTSSFGVATGEFGESATDILSRADAALYQAKSAGRDRVIAAAPIEDEPDAKSA
ncbi:MAG: GGDEF domain-containing protein, partial [Alphaproteobacteria bacterium]